MKIQSFTIQGKRKENEDYVLSKEIDRNNSIHIVADGMGGYQYGRLAAETVANYISTFISENIGFESKPNLIKTAIEEANNEVGKLLSIYNEKMGTTIGAILKSNSNIYAYWVGDVKIIQIRDEKVIFESEDHSLINQLKKTSLINSDIQLGKIRHIVTKSIQGKNENFEPTIVELKFKTKDKIVICSDGILNRTNIQTLAKNFNIKSEENKHIANEDNSSLILIDL